MNTYLTEIWALCPKDNVIKQYGGPNVPADTASEAQEWLDENELGYCKVIGKIVSTIETPDGFFHYNVEEEIVIPRERLN